MMVFVARAPFAILDNQKRLDFGFGVSQAFGIISVIVVFAHVPGGRFA